MCSSDGQVTTLVPVELIDILGPHDITRVHAEDIHNHLFRLARLHELVMDHFHDVEEGQVAWLVFGQVGGILVAHRPAGTFWNADQAVALVLQAAEYVVDDSHVAVDVPIFFGDQQDVHYFG